MDDADREAEEFFKAMLAVENDPEYHNEWIPAYKFEENANRDLGLKVSNREENDADPPDYFYLVEGARIGMEITSLLGGEVMQQNAHYKRVEEAMKSSVDEIGQKLPPGKYELNFFPGEMKEFAPGFKIDMPIFGNRIAQNEIDKQVTECLRNLVATFEGQYVAAKLTNPNGDLIGTIRLIPLLASDAVDVFINPQGAYLMEDWTEERLKTSLQKCVDEKESQYGGANLSDTFGIPIWLLISDTRDIMSTSAVEFDIDTLVLNSKCFRRIFFVRGIACDYRLSEMRCTMH